MPSGCCLKPLETALKSVNNVKLMSSTAFEGGGNVLLEFEAGFNSDVALADVRAKVAAAQSDLPLDATDPTVNEVNLSLFPVVSVSLSGNLTERALGQIARQAQDAIEGVPGYCRPTLQGTRDEVVEVIAEPMLLKSYGVSLSAFALAAAQGNSLVAAGALEGDQGRFVVKVPALIEPPEDVLEIPVAASNAASVTLGDVATILPTFKDATSITRVGGQSAVVIEVSKRSGANLISTVDAVKAKIEELRGRLGRCESLSPTSATSRSSSARCWASFRTASSRPFSWSPSSSWWSSAGAPRCSSASRSRSPS